MSKRREKERKRGGGGGGLAKHTHKEARRQSSRHGARRVTDTQRHTPGSKADTINHVFAQK